MFFLFCKQKTVYEMRISDWSSDVCSSDLFAIERPHRQHPAERQSARKTRRIFGDVRSGEAEAANRRYFHLVDVGICEGSVERKRQSGCRNDSRLQLNAPTSFIGRVDSYGLAGGVIRYALVNAGRQYVEELKRALYFPVYRDDIHSSAAATAL